MRDFVAALIVTFANLLFGGSLIGIFLVHHKVALSPFFHFGNYGLDGFHCIHGYLYILHCVSWFIVFSTIYINLFQMIISEILTSYCGPDVALYTVRVLQVLFGIWVAGEISGAWCDNQRRYNCVLAGDCESSILVYITNAMEYLCEAFPYSENKTHVHVYESRQFGEHGDEADESTVQVHSFCHRLFHVFPSWLMTGLSSSLAFSCIWMSAPVID